MAQFFEGSDGTIPVISNISGMWREPTTGAPYQISQNGKYFTIKEFSFGVVSAVGNGELDGRHGEFSYTTLLGTYGIGTLQISNDGKHIHVIFSDQISGAVVRINLYR